MAQNDNGTGLSKAGVSSCANTTHCMQTDILFCETQMLDLSLHPRAHLYTTTIELTEWCSVQSVRLREQGRI